MVKYASALPRESIVDVEGKLVAPAAPVEGCSQSQVWAGRQLGYPRCAATNWPVMQQWQPSMALLHAPWTNNS